MASPSGPPLGLSRPKIPRKSPKPSNPSSSPPSLPCVLPPLASPAPQRAASISWVSSLAAGLLPANPFPRVTQPVSEAVQPAEGLHQPLPPLFGNEVTMELIDNTAISDLAGIFPTPSPTDPWHRAHARNCAHATAACAACSISLICCSCRSLRLTPGLAPTSPATLSPARRSLSASPALFRTDVGNGTPPPDFDSHDDEHDDDAYVRALAEADTCDNSSCPNGPDAPARYTITVEVFDDGAEEFYDRHYRACAACNRSCKKSFLGERIKARQFDNSVRDKAIRDNAIRDTCDNSSSLKTDSAVRRAGHVPGSAPYAREHPADAPAPASPKPLTPPPPALNVTPTLDNITRPGDDTNPTATAIILQDALRILNTRPPTPAAFVATIRVKHDALCAHPVSSCPVCSCGLLCCSCKHLFMPAVARHLACAQCKHVAYSCCQSTSCCECGKPWLPSDAVIPPTAPLAQRFRGGAGTGTLSS
ncbi:hypothetical protein AX14_006094, partial [Amanita brunnescens Koide BX004]